jgi:hypothetical protein
MIYSPSRTEAYDFCSLKGSLVYKQGWTPREADNGTVGRIVGAAFAEGTYRIHAGLSDGIAEAQRLFDRQVAHYIQYGVSFTHDMGQTRETLGKSLVKYAAASPFKTWQIKGAEVALKDYGNCRLDVLGIDPEGYWAIADIKYKRQLKLDYLNKTVNEYRDSWQFQHYPWAYNHYAQSINDIQNGSNPWQPAVRMYLVLVIAEPFRILTYPFFTRDKLQIRWLQSAQQKWADIHAIETGERQPTMSATHRDAYGPCNMSKACLEMDLDPALMQFEYVQVPRLPEEGDTNAQAN